MEETKNGKRWISFRVKPEEYNQIYEHFKGTAHKKFSAYARKVLLGMPVIVRYRNHSADEFLSAMLPLKNELHAIGVNFNQAVRQLNSLSKIHETNMWLIRYEMDRKILLQQVAEIKELLIKYYQWSQK